MTTLIFGTICVRMYISHKKAQKAQKLFTEIFFVTN